ncbi:MAG TPA: hypothetical protein ENL08_03785, partial [Bacteroidetes bacterium]|nr:hypothetical protein [Bacteroidota bacterium]
MKTIIPVAVVGMLLYPAPPVISGMKVTSADESGVTVEYHPEILSLDASSDGPIRLQIRDGDILRVPDMPELPSYMATVAIPPGSNPRVTVQERVAGKIIQGSLPLFKAENPGLFHRAEYFQRAQEETVGPLQIRSLAGLRVARIPIYPAMILNNPASIELADRITIRVDFGDYLPPTAGRRLPVKLNRIQKRIVINHKQARLWGRQRTSSFIDNHWPEGEYLYRFEIGKEAVYRLTFEQLREKGVEIPDDGLPSSHIKLFGNGGGDLPLDPGEAAPIGLKECAIHIEDGGDDLFGPGDWLLFYGRGPGGYVQDPLQDWRYSMNHYSTKNYYWLNIFRSTPAHSALRMERLGEDIQPDTVVNNGISRYYVEPERFIYNYGSFSASGLEWYGYTFDGISRLSYPFNLSSPDTTLPANIRLRIVKSLHNPYIEVRLNGELIDGFLPGSAGYPSGNLITNIQSLLNRNVNSLTMEQTTDNAEALFDWFEVSY